MAQDIEFIPTYQEYINLCEHWNVDALSEDDNWRDDYQSIQVTLDYKGYYP